MTHINEHTRPGRRQLKKKTSNGSLFIIRPFISGTLIMALLFSNILFASTTTPQKQPSQKQSHKEIQAAAVEFVRSQIPDDITIKQIKAGKIDSRIRFSQCSQALDTRSTMNRTIAKSWTIGVSCNDDKAWSIYIPVKAELTRKMLVSATTITRGELISADKVKLIAQEITHQNKKYFSDSSDVIGFEARRTIRPNRVINSSMLQQPLLVRKKESVLIYAQSKSIRVSMRGTALKNGHHNEMIKVRNNSSNKIIEALVIDRGIVSVKF